MVKVIQTHDPYLTNTYRLVDKLIRQILNRPRTTHCTENIAAFAQSLTKEIS